MVCVRVLLAMWQVRSSRNLPPESVPCYTVRGRGPGRLAFAAIFIPSSQLEHAKFEGVTIEGTHKSKPWHAKDWVQKIGLKKHVGTQNAKSM